jgi:hypothetical protein
MFAACDLAEQRLSSQLRRFKQRLTDHHRGTRPPMPAPASPREDLESYEDVIERMRGEA